MHVHCPVCKQVPISYVIRPYIDQNTQESLITARVTKENGLSHQEKGPSLIKKKKATISQKKGIAHRKRAMALQEKGMVQRHAKRPRGNTIICRMVSEWEKSKNCLLFSCRGEFFKLVEYILK